MARTRARLVTPVRRLVQLLLVAFVVIYFVLPQIAGARRALHLLAGVNLWLIVLGVALDSCSILSYANLTRAMIHGTPPPYLTLLRINLSTLAVSHVVPGGAAVGGALGFRLLTRFGLSGTDAAFAMAAQGIGSAVVLNLILWVGLVGSILGGSYNPLYATAALVGVLLLGGFSAVVVLLMRGERRAAEVMRAVARRVPLLDEESMIALLTFFGADRGTATLGVVSYRLINFWLPIPLGGLAYLSLQVEQETPEGRRRIAERRKATELRRLAERSLRESEEHRMRISRRGDH